MLGVPGEALRVKTTAEEGRAESCTDRRKHVLSWETTGHIWGTSRGFCAVEGTGCGRWETRQESGYEAPGGWDQGFVLPLDRGQGDSQH